MKFYDIKRQNNPKYQHCSPVRPRNPYDILIGVKDNQLKIKKYLLQLGFQPNLKGYSLLCRLIDYALDGGEILPDRKSVV